MLKTSLSVCTRCQDDFQTPLTSGSKLLRTGDPLARTLVCTSSVHPKLLNLVPDSDDLSPAHALFTQNFIPANRARAAACEGSMRVIEIFRQLAEQIHN